MFVQFEKHVEVLENYYGLYYQCQVSSKARMVHAV